MNMDENKIAFRLKGITTDQYALIPDNYSLEEEVKFGVTVKFGFDETSHIVGVFFGCTFSQDDKPFIILEAGCHFEIKNDFWQDLWDKDTQRLTLPQSFATHLALITVGTARGILHAKTENTIFQQFIIGPINLTEIILGEVVISKIPETAI